MSVHHPKRAEQAKIERTRGIIRFLSWESRGRLELLMRNCGTKWETLITLTFPGVDGYWNYDGRGVKQALRAFTELLRRAGRKYVWVVEFQERGAPHFHIVVDGWISKTRVSRSWARIVWQADSKAARSALSSSKGYRDHVKAGTKVEGVRKQGGIRGYMTQYLKKQQQKVVPECYSCIGRFWGGNVSMKGETRLYWGEWWQLHKALVPLMEWYEERQHEWARLWKWEGVAVILKGGAHMLEEKLKAEEFRQLKRVAWPVKYCLQGEL